MSIEKILEKVDAIESQNLAKIEEIKAEAVAKVEEAKAEFSEKVVALEAKISELNTSASFIKPAKTVRDDVNKSVREQLSKFLKKGKFEKELQIFADEGQHDAYMKESSSLTGGGAGVGNVNANNDIKVYPNPATYSIHIEAAKMLKEKGWRLTAGDKVGFVVLAGKGRFYSRVKP